MHQTPAERSAPSRRTLALIVGPILAVVVVGTLGNMFHPQLLKDHPLWLVAMEPRNRFLLLVVLSVVVTLVWLWDQRRRGRSGLRAIGTIEKELDEATGDRSGEKAGNGRDAT